MTGLLEGIVLPMDGDIENHVQKMYLLKLSKQLRKYSWQRNVGLGLIKVNL